jgi:hypothetical protein
MRIVIVYKTTRRSGRITTRESLLDVERVTIGRGTDNDIQLSGLAIEFHHSELRKQPDGVHLHKVEATDVEINGRRTSERKLKDKDRIRIGNFQLTVLPTQGDEDVRVELEAVTRRRSEIEELSSRTLVGLNRGFFTERRLSWLGVFAIPLVFFALPVVTAPHSSAGTSQLPSQTRTHGMLETLWDTGPMARAHSYFAEECSRCHVVPFTRVLDTQCLACHADIHAHTPPDVKVVDLETVRCASCHMEHNGAFDLKRLDQELCADCHTQLGDYAPNTRVREVSDFGKDHPDFRMTVPTDALEAPKPTRMQARTADLTRTTRALERIEWNPSIKEISGVKFNHVRHVGREEIKGKNRARTGKLLDCGDCHRMDAAGKNMLPINFEEHCQSCHSIGFDERFEDREAIHGDPADMRADILEFYTSKELERIEAQKRVRRERVGEPVSEGERAAAMEGARRMSERASDFLFKEGEPPGACANCHTVKPGAAPDRGDDVAPVRLLNLWLPMSVFAHKTHEPFPCRDCHPASAVYDPKAIASYESVKDLPDAEKERPDWSLPGRGHIYALYTPEQLKEAHGLEPSKVATDVLIPGIDRCQTCHAGSRASSPLVPSECVLCHPFHRREYDRMRPIEVAPAARNQTENISTEEAG